jgi:phage gpG-like protein
MSPAANDTVLSVPVFFEFNLESIDAAVDALKAAFEDEMEKACEDIGNHVVRRTTEYIKNELEGDRPLVDTGRLVSSITYAAEKTDTGWATLVGTNVFYAKYQEYGTTPHWVPFDVAEGLYLELQRKWGWVEPSPKELASLQGKHTRWLKPFPDARPMWGCRVSGKAQPFLQPGFEMSEPFIVQRLEDAGAAAGQAGVA